MNWFELVAHEGNRRPLEADKFCALLEPARLKLCGPFAESRVALAASVGARLMKTRRINDNPAIAYFAYWIRKSALQRLSESFGAGLPPLCRAGPRGLVFHLPPQNVETIFLYSWIISYLAGNANVVRLPTVISSAIEQIVRQIVDHLAEAGENTQFFVHFPADIELNARLCALSDVRIVWGGDAKVATFGPLPLRNGGRSIWFGDRFSYAVLKGDALTTLDSHSRADLADRLCNDVMVFDQMACSSPHIIFIVGDTSRHEPAVRSVLKAVAASAESKGFRVADGHVLRKMVMAYKAAGSGDVRSIDMMSNALTTVELENPGRNETRVGGGFLQIGYIDRLMALRDLMREHDQTLTYYGFNRAELEALFPLSTPLGLTRVVPIGEALNFDTLWDGYNLLYELTRLIRIV